MKTAGEIIKAYRIKNKISATALLKTMRGIAPNFVFNNTYYSQIENKQKIPSPEYLDIIVKATTLNKNTLIKAAIHQHLKRFKKRITKEYKNFETKNYFYRQASENNKTI